MKYAVLAACLIWNVAHAGQRAITDQGHVVILNDDGTWQFEQPDANRQIEIETNDAQFLKSETQSFQVKSARNDTTVWIDPKLWSFNKGRDGSASEYQFQLKGADLYGMVITEQIEMGLETLADVAFQNAKNAAPDARIVSQEYRTVNGNKVLHMRMDGTMHGIKFTYLGYYFSNQFGSTQLVSYTATNLVTKYQQQIDAFLNGFALRD